MLKTWIKVQRISFTKTKKIYELKQREKLRVKPLRIKTKNFLSQNKTVKCSERLKK